MQLTAIFYNTKTNQPENKYSVYVWYGVEYVKCVFKKHRKQMGRDLW